MKFLNKIDSAEQLIQDENHRLVSDVEKTKWNTVESKETPAGAQTKATKALTDSKAYVDGKVKTDVPVGAKFTDTITTINGKTGTIAKADIVALGIPAVDTNTTYTAGANMSLNGTTFNAVDTKDWASITGKPATFAPNTHTHSTVQITDINQSLRTTDTVQFKRVGVGTSSPNFGVDSVEDIRVRDNASLKMGGVGAADVGFEMKFDKESNSVNFNFFS